MFILERLHHRTFLVYCRSKLDSWMMPLACSTVVCALSESALFFSPLVLLENSFAPVGAHPKDAEGRGARR
jgi:hypothetical protein